MDRTTARGNRLGLTLLGLPLLAAGGYALARGLGAFGARQARDTLVTPEVTAFFAANPWLWWALAAVALLLVLLGLRWLLAQGRKESVGGLRLGRGPDGTTDLESAGVVRALESDLARHPAIRQAHADVGGMGARPEVRLRLTVDEDAPMDTVLDHVGRETIPSMRDALEVEHLPTVVRLGLARPANRPRALR